MVLGRRRTVGSKVDEAGTLRNRGAIRGTPEDRRQERAVSGLFVMIGATPRTDWLPSGISRDDRGYVLTGADAPHDADAEHARLPFETTMPGVFALGDVRAGSVKRIAAAVGEGSAAVAHVHSYLARVAANATAEDGAAGEQTPVPVMEPAAAASTRR